MPSSKIAVRGEAGEPLAEAAYDRRTDEADAADEDDGLDREQDELKRVRLAEGERGDDAQGEQAKHVVEHGRPEDDGDRASPLVAEVAQDAHGDARRRWP